jgi:hypothetical protein
LLLEASNLQLCNSATLQLINYFTESSRPLYRAAALRWISPFRADRSSSWIARFLSAADASGVVAFFKAVRSVERWARLRAAAAMDFRWCLAAEAILGKGQTPERRKTVPDMSREA